VKNFNRKKYYPRIQYIRRVSQHTLPCRRLARAQNTGKNKGRDNQEGHYKIIKG
jgi:hypothetical protein